MGERWGPSGGHVVASSHGNSKNWEISFFKSNLQNPKGLQFLSEVKGSQTKNCRNILCLHSAILSSNNPKYFKLKSVLWIQCSTVSALLLDRHAHIYKYKNSFFSLSLSCLFCFCLVVALWESYKAIMQQNCLWHLLSPGKGHGYIRVTILVCQPTSLWWKDQKTPVSAASLMGTL